MGSTETVNIPNDKEAERAVLGAIMIDNKRLSEIVSIIGIDDFYTIGNRLIFESMLSAAHDGDPIDPVTVGTRLSGADRKVIGGVGTLGTLADNIGAVSSVSVYAHRVKNCAIRRRAMDAAEKMLKVCASENIDAAEVSELSECFRDVAELSGGQRTKTLKLASGIEVALSGLKRFASGDHSDRVQIGIPKIDWAMRGGMIPGALYLIGAPPGGGKTTLLQNVAVNCARSRGPVLFVSPEMATWELSEREIIRRSGVPLDGRGPWVQWTEQQENEALHIKAACDIEKEGIDVHCIDEQSTMSDVSSRARSIKGLKLIIIDYAQEIANPDPRVARYLAVGAVGHDAIRIGKELNCPVAVASQVNKSQKGDYTFRESGDLHQRAHVSMIMESKRSETPNRNGYFEIESTKIFSMKNRSGPMFSVPVDYEPATYRIGEYKTESMVWTPKDEDVKEY